MFLLRSRFLPPKPYAALTLGPLVLLRRGMKLTHTVWRHENIHWHQCRELLFVGFYLWYGLEWLLRFVGIGVKSLLRRTGGKSRPSFSALAQQAYFRVCFEREAYARQADPAYLSHRPFMAFLRYLH